MCCLALSHVYLLVLSLCTFATYTIQQTQQEKKQRGKHEEQVSATAQAKTRHILTKGHGKEKTRRQDKRSPYMANTKTKLVALTQDKHKYSK